MINDPQIARLSKLIQSAGNDLLDRGVFTATQLDGIIYLATAIADARIAVAKQQQEDHTR